MGQSSPSSSSTVRFQSCQLEFHIFSYLPGCFRAISVYAAPFFSSPVQPCPSFFLRHCLLLFSWCVRINSFLSRECWHVAYFGIILYDLISVMVLSGPSWHPHFRYAQSVLIFLSDRPTLRDLRCVHTSEFCLPFYVCRRQRQNWESVQMSDVRPRYVNLILNDLLHGLCRHCDAIATRKT